MTGDTVIFARLGHIHEARVESWIRPPCWGGEDSSRHPYSDTCRSEGSVDLDKRLKTLFTTQTACSPNANVHGQSVLIGTHVPLDAAVVGAFFH